MLLFDVGNTRIKWRYIGSGESISGSTLSKSNKQLDNDIQLVATKVGKGVQKIGIACVAGESISEALGESVSRAFACKPVFAKVEKCFAGVEAAYDDVSQLGVDRWLKLLAVRSEGNGDAIIIDSGSALTIDYLQADGRHVGGLILPGVEVMLRGLTAKASAVNVEALELSSKWSAGVDTLSCVENGFAALIQGLCNSITAYERGRFASEIIVAGGGAKNILPFLPDACYEEELVLKGLSIYMNTRVN